MNTLGSTKRNRWRVSAEKVDLIRPDIPARAISFAAEPRDLKLDLSRTAIVVIDMQNDFCHPDGWLASIGVDVEPARAPIAPLTELLPRLRQQDVPVIWLNWGNRPDLLNISPALQAVYDPEGKCVGLGAPLPSNGAPILQAGSWAAATVDELTPAPRDIQVDKYRMSGFWDTPLDSILRNLGVTTLLFAGVNSDQCVMCTLQDANFLGYDCIMLDDCSATTSPDFCAEATRYNVKQCFGFVANSQALIGAMGAVQEAG